MNPFTPDAALALGRIASTLADFWALYARLAALATERTLEVNQVIQVARGTLGDLAPMRSLLAELAETLPAPSGVLSEDEDIELDPLELTRAQVECVLADRLDPAIEALTALCAIGEAEAGPSVEEARSGLLCFIADRLLPSIAGLTAALVVFEDICQDEHTS
jgi:hypothetical protein